MSAGALKEEEAGLRPLRPIERFPRHQAPHSIVASYANVAAFVERRNLNDLLAKNRGDLAQLGYQLGELSGRKLLGAVGKRFSGVRMNLDHDAVATSGNSSICQRRHQVAHAADVKHPRK